MAGGVVTILVRQWGARTKVSSIHQGLEYYSLHVGQRFYPLLTSTDGFLLGHEVGWPADGFDQNRGNRILLPPDN